MLIKAECGEMIHKYIQRCTFAANIQCKTVECEFNELQFKIYPDSYIQDICEKYDLLCKIRRLERD